MSRAIAVRQNTFSANTRNALFLSEEELPQKTRRDRPSVSSVLSVVEL